MPDGALAASILVALDMTRSTVEPVGVGLASDAWLVRDKERRLVLRVTNDPEYPATYAMEHALLARLSADGAPVPAPVAGDWDVRDWPGPSFSLTTWVPGMPLPAASRLAVAAQLAAFIRALQSVEAPGFGALVVRDGQLRGEADDRDAGILAWATRPFWPLGDARFDAHVPLAARPTLRARLERHADTVGRALAAGPTVVIHGDLHEENVLEADGAIHVIDFGEALVGPAAWEFASLAYFLGWPVADATVDALMDDGVDRARLRTDAAAIALAFGVYRWHQDHDLGVHEEVYNASFLEETLERQPGRA